MESYLKGRGGNQSVSNDSGFSSYLSSNTATEGNVTTVDLNPETQEIKEVIYQEEGAPKVEAISVDGKPTRLLIHFENDKILEIDCLY